MDAPERIVWSEGMLISPQHLQQETLYHERLLSLRLQATNPYAWGVAEFEVDRNALDTGQFEFSRFSGILPCGLPVSFEKGKRPGPTPRPLEEVFRPAQKSMQVFLGVPREREGVSNVSRPEDRDLRTRFQTVTRDVSDLTTGRMAQVTVAYARTNVMVLFDDEANDDFDSIKVCELVRNKDGQYEVSQDYVPACLRLGASPMIMRGFNRLLGLIAAKQRALAETTRESSSAALEFRSSDITTFLQFNAVSSMMPIVAHIAESPELSPWQAYILLSMVTGQLLTFSAKADPTQVPKFMFHDLGTTFRNTFELIASLLSGTLVKKFERVDLKLFRNGVMVGAVEDEPVRKSDTFILTAKASSPEVVTEKMITELPRLSKIGAKGNIKDLIQSASNGVPLKVTHRPPPEVPIRDGVVYFQLNVQDDNWKVVLNERNIAVFMPRPYQPGNVLYELLAIPPA